MSAARESCLARDARDIQRFAAETDVLVVGLGAAGAAATIEARAAGARVMAVERASGGGGTSAMSGGVLYLGGGTPVQKECGFEDSAEDMYKYLIASVGPTPDEAKIALYSEGSLEHFHWVTDCGVPFKAVFYPGYSGEPPNEDGLVYSGNEQVYPFCEIARPAPRGHVPRIPGQAGGLLMQHLLATTEKTGAELHFDTRCTALVQHADGSVAGAVLRSGDREISVRARRGVVLTTGGFINNRDMIERYAPLLLRCKFRVGAEGDDGSGIALGMAVGGAAIHMEQGSVSLPIHPPKEISKGILVNAQGQRFVAEDSYFGRLGEHILYHQQGHAYWVLDDATFVRPDVPREVAGVGNTWAELEAELMLPTGSLESSVALYNRHAANGRDPLFHKRAAYLTPLTRPPFGAFDCTTDNSLFAAFTLGGLSTDADGRVRDASDAAIPGLYAAGRATSGIAAPGYSSGLSLGDGTFFGRRAGRAAASA